MRLSRLLMVASVLVSARAGADGKLEQIRARGKLIVSVKNDANHAHKDPAHAQKRGFEIELAQAIARRLLGDGARLELRLLARPVRLPMLATGAVDLVISMIPVTADNARQCDLSHPYFSSGLSLLALGSAPVALSTLAGKTVAFRKQSFNNYGDELRRIAVERRVKLEIRYYPTFAGALDAVTKGEVAAMGGNFVELDACRRDHPEPRLTTTLLAESLVAVAVKKGDADLLKLVNDTIDGLQRSGELERMTARWHLPYLLPRRARW